MPRVGTEEERQRWLLSSMNKQQRTLKPFSSENQTTKVNISVLSLIIKSSFMSLCVNQQTVKDFGATQAEKTSMEGTVLLLC